MELWHRRLKVIVGKPKSDLNKLVDKPKSEVIYSKNIISKIQNGEKIKNVKER